VACLWGLPVLRVQTTCGAMSHSIRAMFEKKHTPVNNNAPTPRGEHVALPVPIPPPQLPRTSGVPAPAASTALPPPRPLAPTPSTTPSPPHPATTPPTLPSPRPPRPAVTPQQGGAGRITKGVNGGAPRSIVTGHPASKRSKHAAHSTTKSRRLHRAFIDDAADDDDDDDDFGDLCDREDEDDDDDDDEDDEDDDDDGFIVSDSDGDDDGGDDDDDDDGGGGGDCRSQRRSITMPARFSMQQRNAPLIDCVTQLLRTLALVVELRASPDDWCDDDAEAFQAVVTRVHGEFSTAYDRFSNATVGDAAAAAAADTSVADTDVVRRMCESTLLTRQPVTPRGGTSSSSSSSRCDQCRRDTPHDDDGGGGGGGGGGMYTVRLGGRTYDRHMLSRCRSPWQFLMHLGAARQCKMRSFTLDERCTRQLVWVHVCYHILAHMGLRVIHSNRPLLSTEWIEKQARDAVASLDGCLARLSATPPPP